MFASSTAVRTAVLTSRAVASVLPRVSGAVGAGVARVAGGASATRSLSSGTAASEGFNVAVAGAAGGIGQPLSLLMKQHDLVSELRLYDIVNAPGVAADLSHIPTKAQVSAPATAEEAFEGADCIIIPAGIPRKPGMTRDDLFDTNCSIVAQLVEAIAKTTTPGKEPFVLIISNPVNSTVPLAAETLKKHNAYNPATLFGVTALDVIRANTFVAENQGLDATQVEATVVGGHAGTTIVPLLSQIPNTSFSDADRDALTQRIMFGGDEVVQAKDGTGSATLSMAVAGARFADRVLRAAAGEQGIVECAFVESTVTDLPFFSSPVELGANGVHKVNDVGPVTDYEQKLIDDMIGDLGTQINKGLDFAAKN